jgi:hypothetical protein
VLAAISTKFGYVVSDRRYANSIPTIIHSRPVALASTREYLKGAGALAYRRAQDEAEADNVFGVPLFIFERETVLGP